jgi:hypothetical protein
VCVCVYVCMCLYVYVYTHTHGSLYQKQGNLHGPSVIHAEWNEVIQSYLEKCAAVIICVKTKSLIFNIRIGKQKYFATFYYLQRTECIPVLYITRVM